MPAEAEETAEAPPPEEIVVTGTRTGRRLGEAPVAVDVITRQQIEDSGAYDLGELLDQQAGVDVVRDALGASVRLRGMDADQVLYLVDGQRIVGRTGGVLDLTRIPLESIERIEIVKGPASALYGSDAVGGVIQIVTREAREPEGSLSARGATPWSGDATGSVAAAGGPGGVRLTGGWHGSPTFDLDPATLPTDIDSSRTGDLAIRLDPEAGANVELPISASYALTDARGIDGNEGGALFDRRTLSEDLVGSIRPMFLVGTASKLSTHVGVSLFRDQYLSDQRQASALDLYEETWETLAQASVQLDVVAGEDQLWTVGVEGFAEWLRTPRLEAGSGTRQRGAVFVQDEWELVDEPRLVLVPGARLDLDTWFGVKPTPKLAARFDPHATVTLRGSVGYGYRAPSFRELLLRFENPTAGYVVTGNPDLQPETSRTVDAAFEWDPVDRFGLSIAAWWTHLDDLIDIGTLEEGTGGIRFGYINVDQARTRGIETSLAAEPHRHLDLDLSYTLTDAWNLTEDRPLSGRAVHRGSVSASLRVPASGSRIGARASIVGPRQFFADDQIGFFGPDSDEPTISEPYALLDARVEQRLVDELSLFAGVDNALNAGEPIYQQAAPRLFYAGIEARVSARSGGAP